MYKSFLILIGMFILSNAAAQVEHPFESRQGVISANPKSLDKIEGTPYMDEEFKKGKILFENGDTLEVYLRYNVLDEEMEIKADAGSSKIFNLTSARDAQYLIGDQTFERNRVNYEGSEVSGYFHEVYNGKKLRLLRKMTAQVSEPKPAKTAYGRDKPGRIEIDEKFIIVFRDGRTEVVKLKKRDLRKAFDYPEVREYLSDNKIKTTEDLVDFMVFYEKL